MISDGVGDESMMTKGHRSLIQVFNQSQDLQQPPPQKSLKTQNSQQGGAFQEGSANRFPRIRGSGTGERGGCEKLDFQAL